MRTQTTPELPDAHAALRQHSCLTLFAGEKGPIHSDEGTLGLESGGPNTVCQRR